MENPLAPLVLDTHRLSSSSAHAEAPTHPGWPFSDIKLCWLIRLRTLTPTLWAFFHCGTWQIKVPSSTILQNWIRPVSHTSWHLVWSLIKLLINTLRCLFLVFADAWDQFPFSPSSSSSGLSTPPWSSPLWQSPLVRDTMPRITIIDHHRSPVGIPKSSSLLWACRIAKGEFPITTHPWATPVHSVLD
jgi:hypothetical protein